MFSERLRARLEALNREPLPEDAPGDSAPADSSADHLAAQFATARQPDTMPQSLSMRVAELTARPLFAWQDQGRDELVTLPTAVETKTAGYGRTSPDTLPGEETLTAWGPHWIWRRSLEEIWPQGRRFWQHPLSDGRATDDGEAAPGGSSESEHASKATVGGNSATDETAPDRDARLWRQHFPANCVLLDLETCGLAGSVVFLVGVIHWHGGHLVLSQLWARNYAEEKAILQSLWSLMADCQVLATFNGKSFDWPQVHDRSTMHHLGYRLDPGSTAPTVRPLSLVMPTEVPRGGSIDGLSDANIPAPMQPSDQRNEPHHIDLLHHSRRVWRQQLPNCRLQTLERYICGRHRVGDLPGSEIPEAYHDYVRTGGLRQVRAILHHNALDLVTLLQLALAIFKPTTGARIDR